jgi:hypothetical protein
MLKKKKFIVGPKNPEFIPMTLNIQFIKIELIFILSTLSGSELKLASFFVLSNG